MEMDKVVIGNINEKSLANNKLIVSEGKNVVRVIINNEKQMNVIDIDIV